MQIMIFLCKHFHRAQSCPKGTSCGFAHRLEHLDLPAGSAYTDVWTRQSELYENFNDRCVDYWVGQEWKSSQKELFYAYYTLDKRLNNSIPLWARGAAVFYDYEDVSDHWTPETPWDYGLRKDRTTLTEFQLCCLKSCEEWRLFIRLRRLHKQAENAYLESIQTSESDSDQWGEWSGNDDAMANNYDNDVMVDSCNGIQKQGDPDDPTM